MSNAFTLAQFIVARMSKGSVASAAAADSFECSAMFLITANSDQELTKAAAALPVGKAGKILPGQPAAIGEAIATANKAMRDVLPNGAGWIGATNGAFSKATKEQRLPYLQALTVGKDAFLASLTESGQFTDVVPKTAEEKAAAKAAKTAAAEAKAAEAKAAIKADLLASGEVVASDSIVKVDDCATSMLVDVLSTRNADTFSVDSIGMLKALLSRLTVTA